MPQKSVYVTLEDLPLWERFTELASERKQSVSMLLMKFVRIYVEQTEAGEAK